MNAVTKQYYTIDVRGSRKTMYFICKTPEERDKKLNELYSKWDESDEWRVDNPIIIVGVHRYSTASPDSGHYF